MILELLGSCPSTTVPNSPRRSFTNRFWIEGCSTMPDWLFLDLPLVDSKRVNLWPCSLGSALVARGKPGLRLDCLDLEVKLVFQACCLPEYTLVSLCFPNLELSLLLKNLEDLGLVFPDKNRQRWLLLVLLGIIKLP